MARIRSIKPGFCTSEAIAALPVPVRLHFAMLWTHCDDHGRGVDNPRLIKAALWPLDDDVTAAVVESYQETLADHGRIDRYEVDGKRYFQVLRWDEHQRPQRPADSVIPESSAAAPVPVADGSASDPRGVAAVVGVVEGEGEVGERDTSPEVVPVPDPPPAVAHRYPASFEGWWNAYPRKVGKQDAARAYTVAARKVGHDRLREALAAHNAAWERWPESERSFIPHPATWLRGGRYDDPPPGPRRPVGGTKADATRAKLAAALDRMEGRSVIEATAS